MNLFVEVFDCKESQMNRYKVNFIKNSLKALACSTKVAIRVADTGLKYNISFDKENSILIFNLLF